MADFLKFLRDGSSFKSRKKTELVFKSKRENITDKIVDEIFYILTNNDLLVK